jgi:hypothetical protein
VTSSDDQPRHTGRTRWAALLAAAIGGAIAAPLLAIKGDLTSLIAIAVTLVSGATAWFATKRLRPWSSTSAWALLVVVAIAFVSSLGMKSLWLSAYGEPTNGCLVTGRSEHTSRRAPTYYTNELNCGSLQLSYRPGPGYTSKPIGERIDLVIDRTGFAGYTEPGTIKPLISSLTGLAVLTGAAYFTLVLRWPPRKPKKQPGRPKLERGFL